LSSDSPLPVSKTVNQKKINERIIYCFMAIANCLSKIDEGKTIDPIMVAGLFKEIAILCSLTDFKIL